MKIKRKEPKRTKNRKTLNRKTLNRKILKIPFENGEVIKLKRGAGSTRKTGTFSAYFTGQNNSRREEPITTRKPGPFATLFTGNHDSPMEEEVSTYKLSSQDIAAIQSDGSPSDNSSSDNSLSYDSSSDDNSSDGSYVPHEAAKFDTHIQIEFFFNPDIHIWNMPTWKTPTKKIIYTYSPYNEELTTRFPILFDSLPSHVKTGLYVPIYAYINDPTTMASITDATMGIDAGTFHVYKYGKDILLKNLWNRCLKLAKKCPFTTGLKKRITKSCCGFIAPAMGVVLHFVDDFNKRSQQLDDYQINLAINMGINFYSKYTGYGNSEFGWNNNCNKWSNVIAEGTNIMTLYGRVLDPNITDCSTYHHFIIYRKGGFCIIIDVWAGGGGDRSEWIRIMRTNDIVAVLHEISTTTDLDNTDRLLNAYFIVPHSTDVPNNINKNLQDELLSVGAYNLTDWNKEMIELLELAKGYEIIINGGYQN